MSDYGPDCGGRIKGVTIVKPIVYGNVARYFGKKREEDGHTHSWNVYVKPYQNEDMSTYVKKVHFKLHESYANPNRIITKPPFEVTETGWGEFEVAIKLYFMDPNERPITIYHILKLFETDPTSKAINIKKYLISEFYDEIIFQDPSAMMQQLLTNTRQFTIGPYKHETDFEEKKQKTIASIQSAKTKVRSEIEELKDRLKQTQSVIAKFKENIASAESKQEHERKLKQAQQQQSSTPTTLTPATTSAPTPTPKSPVQSLKSPQSHQKQEILRLQSPPMTKLKNIESIVEPEPVTIQPTIEPDQPIPETSLLPQQLTSSESQPETQLQSPELKPETQDPPKIEPMDHQESSTPIEVTTEITTMTAT